MPSTTPRTVPEESFNRAIRPLVASLIPQSYQPQPLRDTGGLCRSAGIVAVAAGCGRCLPWIWTACGSVASACSCPALGQETHDASPNSQPESGRAVNPGTSGFGCPTARDSSLSRMCVCTPTVREASFTTAPWPDRERRYRDSPVAEFGTSATRDEASSTLELLHPMAMPWKRREDHEVRGQGVRLRYGVGIAE